MTESEVRKLLRRMKELDSQTAFRSFYDMTYDRLYRIAYYYVKRPLYVIVGNAVKPVVRHIVEGSERRLRVQLLHSS